MKIAAATLLGYALGSIPFGYIIGRLKKIDLKRSGSGNIGATNVGRVLGLKYFIVVFLLDAIKGAGAVYLAYLLGLNMYLAGIGAIAGHILNPYLKFHGGKGVATAIGVFLALFPKILFLSFAVWAVIYLATFYVSLASLVFAVALSVFYNLLSQGTPTNRIVVVIMSLLIVAAHLPNIRRLIEGREPTTIIWRRK